MKRRTFMKGTAAVITAALVPVLSDESLVPAVHSLEEVDRLARQSTTYSEGILYDKRLVDALQDSTRDLMNYGTSAIKVSYV